MVIEQKPLADLRITLSPDRTDPFGVPLAAIHSQVGADDLDHIRQTADAFETTWNETNFARLGAWRRYTSDEGAAHSNTAGIFHPTGSTRMGADAERGVVDAHLRLFTRPQIQLLVTSVLSTGGGR